MIWNFGGGRGPPLSYGKFFCVLMLLSLFFSSVVSEKNKHYHIASLCKSPHLHYRKIDGAVLRSQNEPNLDCVITFQTETILQRFMLRFEHLRLDCNDHLLIYDGGHATGNYKADLSCPNTRQSVGTIYTRTNYVTLKYVTDQWGTESNGFHLVITAFKDKTELACKDFRCGQKDFCISSDLLCDGVNHCGDNSDETNTSLCADQQSGKILGLHFAVFCAVVASVGVVLSALLTGIIICCCRRRSLRRQAASAGAASNTGTSNGRLEDKPPAYSTTATPMSGYQTLPSHAATFSGNWVPPAVGQGRMLQQLTSFSSFSITLTTAACSATSSSYLVLQAIPWCLAK